ncbi:MAG: sensor histidine kinase, partial [Solirubrobacteraceae bacterium]
AGACRAVLGSGRAAPGGVVRGGRDDGRGIAPDEAATGNSGLAGMRERALLIGARLEIAGRPGEGTEVRLLIPGDAIA